MLPMSKAGTESTGASAERGLTSHRQDAAGDDFANGTVEEEREGH